MTDPRHVGDLLRTLAPQVTGILARRYGHWEAAEDAVQESLIVAVKQWQEGGVPDHPRGWLITVATRRFIDALRSELARREREAASAQNEQMLDVPDDDDSLTLLFLCCHPALGRPSQLALTLRAVGGLTTRQIAAAFLVPESTMAQRISRAKRQIRDAGATFDLPDEAEQRRRLGVVMQVLYLIFNEGYTPGTERAVTSLDLTREAIRLARLLHDLVPGNAEAAGLLALMLLTDARREARQQPNGMLVPLDEQDRSKWDRDYIDEGTKLLSSALGSAPPGPYQLQAAIAALHDEAPTAAQTDWPQILALYSVLERVSPNPVVSLNRAVAVAMVSGPREGLRIVERLSGNAQLAQSHRLDVVRGYLLEMAGDREQARESYLRAVRRTTSVAEQRYLSIKASKLNVVP
ncbi:RNA polymerase sigma factor (sigma-70 family) [Antricoccus suffuscus]|uniref:RNA polymerase sigma factor (Sigma-70 family) n=1 Tax=Antricoccus suffuscus TaxID=1629062 RepID=A0A2T0ZWD9_9ACTN|nr:sigma-70 family RNA polymerase sigma factor [Antricoccus suffuscus]PRZ40643.1 RNA polymerase sigma factor (sigma-70 family) [Antricoccus suffuscus]